MGAKQELDAVKRKLRAALVRRGIRGIFSLGRTFRIADDDGSKSLDANEFSKAMRDFRVELTEDVRVAVAALAAQGAPLPLPLAAPRALRVREPAPRLAPARAC